MATTLGLLILIAATALIVPIINYLSNAEMRLRQLPADTSRTIKETYRPLFVLAAAIAILLPLLANVAVFPQEIKAIFIPSAIALSGLIVTLALMAIDTAARLELRTTPQAVRLPSFSGHPICTDPVSVGEDVHCESTAQEVHAGVPA